MSLSWILYLADVLDSLSCVFTLGFIILLIAGVAGLIVFAHMADYDDDKKPLLKFLNTILKFFIVCLVGVVLIPSSKTIYMILATNYLDKTQIPAKVELIIEKKLDQYLIEK